jgi:hypothetical protein
MTLRRMRRYAFITPCPLCNGECKGHLEVDHWQLTDGESVRWIAIREKEEDA